MLSPDNQNLTVPVIHLKPAAAAAVAALSAAAEQHKLQLTGWDTPWGLNGDHGCHIQSNRSLL